MNTDDTDKRKVDALEALAAREKIEAAKDAGTQAGPDPFSRLEAQAAAEPELIFEDEPQAEGAQDFMRMMAQESQMVNPELSKLRALTGGGADGATANGLPDVPPGGGFVTVTAPVFSAPQRSARLQANARRMHKHAFKQTMIPLLLAVGGLLILLSMITMVILAGDSSRIDSMAAEGTYMRTYGKFFVIVSLPTGAILIMGAWMFFLDTRKSGGARR